MRIASCCCPYAYWKQANHHMHMGNGDVAVISIPIRILALTKSPYAYGDFHMHTGMEHAACPRMQMGIAICIQWNPQFCKKPRMHMGIPIFMQWFPYAYGDLTADSSPCAYSDHHMHTGNPIILEQSRYAYGDFSMHAGIAICIWGYNNGLIPVCRWGLPYAYGDLPVLPMSPRVHMGIPICIWGSLYAYGDAIFTTFTYANGDCRMHTVITICIFESPFAYRDAPYVN